MTVDDLIQEIMNGKTPDPELMKSAITLQGLALSKVIKASRKERDKRIRDVVSVIQMMGKDLIPFSAAMSAPSSETKH